MKRLLSLAIIASFAMSYTVPALAIEDGRLKGFNKMEILKTLKPNSLEYDEVNELL